jgi:hypothetical protein
VQFEPLCPDLDLQPNFSLCQSLNIHSVRLLIQKEIFFGVKLLLLIHKRFRNIQCCGSGSGIRYLFDPLYPGYGMDKKIKIRIQYEHPKSYFRELINNFLGENAHTGSGLGKFGSGSRDKHPGSATLVIYRYT